MAPRIPSRFMPRSPPPTPAAAESASEAKKVWGPTTVRRAGRHRIRRTRRGGLLTSTGIKPLMTPASLGSEGSMDTAKASFKPTLARKGKGRKTRRRHRK